MRQLLSDLFAPIPFRGSPFSRNQKDSFVEFIVPVFKDSGAEQVSVKVYSEDVYNFLSSAQQKLSEDSHSFIDSLEVFLIITGGVVVFAYSDKEYDWSSIRRDHFCGTSFVIAEMDEMDFEEAAVELIDSLAKDIISCTKTSKV